MKTLLLLATLLTISYSANAQFFFGIKGGLNASTLVNSSSTATKGFNMGVYANYPINDSFSIQPELFYNTTGGFIKQAYPFIGQSLDASIKLEYISLPVLIKYSFRKTKFNLSVGPQISFLMSAKKKFSSTTTDIKSTLKATDFSAIINIGYHLTKNSTINLRGQFGLSNINTVSSAPIRSNVFSLSLFQNLK